MKQLENRSNNEIKIEIYPKGIIERFKLLFCNRIIINIDLTTSSNDGILEVYKTLRTR